ncbi:unnamed protein product [Dovyalis caffra]|uniref:Uncharacterized protein n=1 Tax=Dovyalis caffra TaxID=77055 RepID=A0AAV1QZD1_9ROSI|nr:unnamed protein product [Dovyalis caffra]
MAGKEENRIFVGGLSWDITERQLETAFNRFGKIVESQIWLSSYGGSVFMDDVLGSPTEICYRHKENCDGCLVPFDYHSTDKFSEHGHGLYTLIKSHTASCIPAYVGHPVRGLCLFVNPLHLLVSIGSLWSLKLFDDLGWNVIVFSRTLAEVTIFCGMFAEDWCIQVYGGHVMVIMEPLSWILWEIVVRGMFTAGVLGLVSPELIDLSSSSPGSSMHIIIIMLKLLPALLTFIQLLAITLSYLVFLQVMLERDTGRPRGFGFITFADRRAMDDAIREMHGRDFGDRVISVNKAQPKMGGDDADHGYRGGYSTGSRGSYGGGDRPAGQDECFKCGRSGHWARDCPSAGGRAGGGGLFSSRSRFGGAGDRGDRFGGDRDRYMDDRYDGGRYGDRDRFDSRDSKYGGRDRYASDRYPPNGDRFAGDRYGGSDRYAQNGYGKDRGYDRDGGPRGGNDRYGGGGPPRNDRSYRNRPGPYDRPSRGGRPSSFERY